MNLRQSNLFLCESFNARQVQSEQTGTSSQKLNVSCISPAFKKPQNKLKGDAVGQKRTSLQDLNASHGQPEAKQGGFSTASVI